MNEYIKKIYDMLYSPILTPYNLLENAKLENYSYVKYYKDKTNLVAEMECKVDDDTKIFYYYFDEKDYLERIYMKTSKNRKIIFDREKEIEKSKIEYYKSLPKLDNII